MLATRNYKEFEIIDINGFPFAQFEGAENASKALPEDRVMMSETGKLVIIERATPKRNLVGVLNLTSKYMYGMTSHGVPMYLCEPYNKAYPCFRVACKEKDRSQNLIIVFQFESWEKGAELPRGALVQRIGPVEDIEVEKAALAWHSSPFLHAPAPVLPSISLPTLSDVGERQLLKEGTFNIDPRGCKDIDDVITLRKQDDGSWRIYITIADVSEIIPKGSKMYAAAKNIGATTYQDGHAVRPMFHPSISEDMCSLLPGALRYGIALQLDWIPGNSPSLQNPQFQKVLVENQESYTYENIYSSKTVPLDVLGSICSCIAGRTISDSHEWIEQLMILYNREAAKILDKMNAGLLRAHDAPFTEKLEALQKVNPALQFLAYQSAKYVSVGSGSSSKEHWGLGEKLYCHATSPLRRFADFVNQQIIKDYMDGSVSVAQESFAQHLNSRQKEIASAERMYIFLEAIHKAESDTVCGTFLWNKNGKAVFWIESWKTTVRVPLVESKSVLVPGEQKMIQYYCDRRKASWKDRMIFSY